MKGSPEKRLTGYTISTCSGGEGCPNTACSCEALADEIKILFEQADLLSFLGQQVTGGLKFHHEFRVVLSECPNACSRPQIADLGIIGAAVPGLSDIPCSLCGECVRACDEQAIFMDPDGGTPIIDYTTCLMCKKCITACPAGTLIEKETGFRVLLGGRLGRHPRLAMEVPGLHSHEEVIGLVKTCLVFYRQNSSNGQRFSRLISSVDQITQYPSSGILKQEIKLKNTCE